MVVDNQELREEIENLRKEAQDNKGHMLEVLVALYGVFCQSELS